jgi:nicotine blue oxidoreductase
MSLAEVSLAAYVPENLPEGMEPGLEETNVYDPENFVYPFGAHAVVAVDLHGAVPVVCADWAEGQAASLRAGLRALSGADAAVVALGDQPRLSATAVARVVAARRPGVDAVRATYGGRGGHPVVLERSLFPRLEALSGDVGARAVLAGVRVEDVPCDGLGRPDDVDTREQLEVLRP